MTGKQVLLLLVALAIIGAIEWDFISLRQQSEIQSIKIDVLRARVNDLSKSVHEHQLENMMQWSVTSAQIHVLESNSGSSCSITQ